MDRTHGIEVYKPYIHKDVFSTKSFTGNQGILVAL